MKKFIIAILFCIPLFMVSAVAEEIGFTYYIIENEGEMCISGIVGNESPETIVFPSEINGEKVYAVRNAVASDNQGGYSFAPVDLKGAKHLVISEGIEMIEWFTGTENLETVVLPKSLKSLPSFAFAGAKKLKSINLEWVERIGSFAFENCVSLSEVKLLHTTKVGIDSFNLIDDLTIYGVKDSEAQKYADENNVDFIKIPDSEKDAHKLYKLGLMKGTGITESGLVIFDLDRTPTRTEAVAMLVRFLGKENAALKMEKTHPFTDVPEWADGYISYAYEKGLTKGMSDTVFGSETPATPEMYLTFMFRSLGYSDSGENKDFTYENPWELNDKVALTSLSRDYESFERSDVVNISISALNKPLKSENMYVFEKMISYGMFTKDEFDYWTE